MNKLSYSLGASIAFNLKGQKISIESFEDFYNGLKDVLTDNNLKLTESEINEEIQNYFEMQQKSIYQNNINEGEQFLEENSKRQNVVTLESGLQYEIIKEGNGEKPLLSDTVTTHYHGTLINGEVFDSSIRRGQPATFPVSGAIKGWTEALQMMSVGSKWKLYIPHHLAYGSQGAGNSIAPYTTLIFEVELIDIKRR
jgi:FKBP-type peptidyl-prolyl cis-trans isomerase FklB